MKIKSFLFCFLISSCTLLNQNWVDEVEADTMQDVLDWTANNIKYYAAPIDYWQTPYETYCTRKGDCKDFCTLAKFLLKEKCNIESELVVTEGNVKGDLYFHVILKINNSYYSPQTGKKL